MRLAEITALLMLGGRDREVRRLLEDAAEAYPGSRRIRAVLARHLAVASDPSQRDGPRAVELTRQLVDDEPSPTLLETLAMALAEAGRFEEAATVQSALLRSAEEERERRRLEASLERYRERLTCCPPRSAVTLGPATPESAAPPS